MAGITERIDFGRFQFTHLVSDRTEPFHFPDTYFITDLQQMDDIGIPETIWQSEDREATLAAAKTMQETAERNEKIFGPIRQRAQRALAARSAS